MSFVPSVQKQSDCFSLHILKGIVARGIKAMPETVTTGKGRWLQTAAMHGGLLNHITINKY